MNNVPSKVLVVGATGSIGQQVVVEGIRQGYNMRVLVRHATQAGQFPSEVEVSVGDLTSTASLADAVDGVDAIVFTHGSNGRAPGPEAVDYGAVRNVLDALKGREARIALMTAIGVTDRRGAHDWKRRGERLVRASGLPYTIVRPGWFDMNASDQHRLVMLQGDRRRSSTPRDGVVARIQLADVLLWSLRSNAALRKTFELISGNGPEQDDFDAVAAPLDADPEGSIDAMHDEANMLLDREPESARADLERIRSSFAPAHREAT